MRAATKDKIAQEVLDWRHEGLIGDELADLLAERFEAGPRLMATLLRWLGFFALLLLGMSILGLIGMMLGAFAVGVAPLLLGGASAAAWSVGVRLTTDPARRYPTSGAVLVTAGLIGLFGALTLLCTTHGGLDLTVVYPYSMLITGVAAVWTAYRYGLRWPLVFGTLVGFHALGSFHGYAGHGAYYLGLRDERVTAVFGVLAVCFGIWHERALEDEETAGRWFGFGHVFIVFGLVYLSVSAWFLSLFPGGLGWVLFFTALCIAYLVAGARLHDSRFVGFGITFLAIDLYTRFFENFWDALPKALFFVIAGAAGAAAGAALELKARAQRRAEAP